MFHVNINAYYSFKVDGGDLPKLGWSWDLVFEL